MADTIRHRWREVRKIAATADIFVLQETHGSQHDLHQMSNVINTHIHYMSEMGCSSSGGVTMSISKQFLERNKFVDIMVRPLVTGRVLQLVATACEGAP